MDFTQYKKWFFEISEQAYKDFNHEKNFEEILEPEMESLESFAEEKNLVVEVCFRYPLTRVRRDTLGIQISSKSYFKATKGEEDWWWVMLNYTKLDGRTDWFFYKCDDLAGLKKLIEVFSDNSGLE